jgi:hypothetical protein
MRFSAENKVDKRIGDVHRVSVIDEKSKILSTNV